MPPSSLPRPHLRALLIDLSGTLHIGSIALPGAVRALQRLDEAGVPYRLCSNASKESSGAVRERLEGMGIRVSGSEGEEKDKMLWTSLGAVREVVRERGYKRCVRGSLYACRLIMLNDASLD
jgi:ribonucleotide monophosphatase NagD (HAD superfamily)